jgi:hypothetical protein
MTTEPTAPTTTTESAPTQEALTDAQTRLAEADEQLRTLPVAHPSRVAWVERKIAAYRTILAARSQNAAAPPGPTAGQLRGAREEVKNVAGPAAPTP